MKIAPIEAIRRDFGRCVLATIAPRANLEVSVLSHHLDRPRQRWYWRHA